MARKRRGRGEGSIYQLKDGSWAGSISLGYDAQGKRIRPSVYGKTKKEVQAKLHKLRGDALSGLPVNPETLTVDQHFEDWFRVKANEVKGTTLTNYRETYRSAIKPHLGHIKLKSLDYRRINALYEHLSERGLTRTVSMVSFLLRAALEDATKKGLVPLNQAKLAARCPQKKKEARFMNQDEIKMFLDAAAGERLENALVLALHTGLRPGEWLGLPWSSIDFKKKQLTVTQALAEKDGRVWISDVKSGAGYRTISLSATALDALKRQKKQQAEEQLSHGERWRNERGLVFTDTRGGLLRRSNVARRLFKPICERADLVGVTPHTLRHTHVSILIFQGVDAKTISARVGHEDVGFTLQVYGHLFPGKDEAAADQTDAFFYNLLQPIQPIYSQ